MKYLYLSLIALLLFPVLLFSQVETVRKGFTHPIDITFIDGKAYVADHGNPSPNLGKIVSFDPSVNGNAYEIIADEILYPRTLAAKDGILYFTNQNSLNKIDVSQRPYVVENIPVEISTFDYLLSMKFVGNKLSLSGKYQVMMLDLDDENLELKTILRASDSKWKGIGTDIEYYKNKLYIAGGDVINTYDLETGELGVLDFDKSKKIYSLLVVNGYLYVDEYYYDEYLENIWVIDLEYIHTEPSIFCDDAISVIGMAEHEEYMYFGQSEFISGEGFKGSVMKVDKKVYSNRDDVTSTNFDNDELEMTLFPNPMVDFVMINGDISDCKRMEIYNTLGQKVKEGVFSARMDVSELRNGIYYFNFLDENNRKLTVKKMIKI